MKWFRRKRKIETPYEYRCFRCGMKAWSTDFDRVIGMGKAHDAWHRNDSLMKDWS